MHIAVLGRSSPLVHDLGKCQRRADAKFADGCTCKPGCGGRVMEGKGVVGKRLGDNFSLVTIQSASESDETSTRDAVIKITWLPLSERHPN